MTPEVAMWFILAGLLVGAPLAAWLGWYLAALLYGEDE